MWCIIRLAMLFDCASRSTTPIQHGVAHSPSEKLPRPCIDWHKSIVKGILRFEMLLPSIGLYFMANVLASCCEYSKFKRTQKNAHTTEEIIHMRKEIIFPTIP
mmetsp:Transcript_39855/g.63914  ORF Transcript_39855/g.63914 Transcript_39855/m.63914 type:complete len:103 (+) Transcript_39855:232-540(+)